MRKAILMSVICMVAILADLKGQNIPTYPIPSYGVALEGRGNFVNSNRVLIEKSRKDRLVNVIVRAEFSSNNPIAKVWIYTTDHETILGPFSVLSSEQLSVNIDDHDWGVLIESDGKVSVDVWIDE
jgi:hypothetical protein